MDPIYFKLPSILREGPMVIKPKLLLTPATQPISTCRIHPLLAISFPLTSRIKDKTTQAPMPFTISQSNTDTTNTADHDWQHHRCLCRRAAERSSLRARQALAVFPQHFGPKPLASSKPPWMTVQVSRWEPPLPTAGNLPIVISCSFLLVAQA